MKKQMKLSDHQIRQGDVLLMRVRAIPTSS